MIQTRLTTLNHIAVQTNARQFRSRNYPLGAVYIFLLEVSVVNSYLCHKVNNPMAVNADAKLVLARQLIRHCFTVVTPLDRHLEDEFSQLMAVVAQGPPIVPLLQALEFRLNPQLGHFQGTDCNGRQACCLHRRRQPTNTFCRTCGVYLHRDVCFFMFHHCRDLLALMGNPTFATM